MSPIDAIADMFAPVVLISAGGIFANGLLSADSTAGKRLQELNSERLSLLGGPGSEKLTEDQTPGIDRTRLRMIDHQVPLVLTRIRGIRDACVLIYVAMGLLVLSVVFIAAAIPAGSVALGYTALALVISGVIVQFAAIVVVTRVMIRSADTLTYETRRTDELGLASPNFLALGRSADNGGRKLPLRTCATRPRRAGRARALPRVPGV